MHQRTRRTRSDAPISYSKRAAVGNTAGTVPPAWRAAAVAQSTNGNAHRREQHQSQSIGSKIILSQLPPDTVTEADVEHLFTTTIGPVFECYLAHNSQGRSKGVAIVHFQRNGDALEARRKYNGKIIDGRRPLKIELIVDPPAGTLPVIKKEKTLAERLSGPINSNGPSEDHSSPPPRPVNPRRLTARVRARSYRQNIKREPRRLNKSAIELDQEMDSYMAARNPIQNNKLKSAARS